MAEVNVEIKAGGPHEWGIRTNRQVGTNTEEDSRQLFSFLRRGIPTQTYNALMDKLKQGDSSCQLSRRKEGEKERIALSVVLPIALTDKEAQEQARLIVEELRSLPYKVYRLITQRTGYLA